MSRSKRELRFWDLYLILNVEILLFKMSRSVILDLFVIIIYRNICGFRCKYFFLILNVDIYVILDPFVIFKRQYFFLV